MRKIKNGKGGWTRMGSGIINAPSTVRTALERAHNE